MLRKLLKYELKSTSRWMVLIYGAVLIMACISGFTMRHVFNMSEDALNVAGDNAMFMIPQMICLVIYGLLIFAMVIVTVFFVIERFYRNMLLGEGYLMHTLPVPTWKLIVSKLISGFIWMALAFVMVVISFFIFSGSASLFKVFSNMDFVKIQAILSENRITIVLVIACTLVQIIRMVLQFYAAMAIGGSANKHKLLISFAAFIVIAIVMSIINLIINANAVFNTIDPDFIGDFFVNSLFIKQMITDAIYGVVFFLITEFFMRKHLNLE